MRKISAIYQDIQVTIYDKELTTSNEPFIHKPFIHNRIIYLPFHDVIIILNINNRRCSNYVR